MVFKQSTTFTAVARGLALVGLLGFSASLGWAQGSDDVAANLAPVGEVCLAGDPCSDAPAAPAAATPAAAPATSSAAPVTGNAAPAASNAAPSTASAAPAATDEPAAPAAAASDYDVAAAYQLRCFACHGTGAAGAPMFGDADAWGERMAKGRDVVLANAINGIGAMPARGLCIDCTDEQIEALMDYMIAGEQ